MIAQEFSPREAGENGMETVMVVVVAPIVDRRASTNECWESVFIQESVAKASVKALNAASPDS